MRRPIAVFMLALFAATGVAIAAETVEPLVPQSSEGIRYLSGGIGEDELAQIEAAKTSYNVKILLAEKSGHYISEVRLTLSSLLGEKLVDIPSAGPFVLLQVPAGTYQIDATYEGHAQQRRITINTARPLSAVLFW